MADKNDRKTCGIVMPISGIDGCTEEHWGDVLSILTESIESADFEANLVSNADDVGIIQKRIIQNLYNNPVVVCDVSGKNPNVMFELGMRLAFDRPTIIVKDDKTSYSFDTSPIEHLEYPRDLRFGKIVEFKEQLKEKIKSTYLSSVNDSSYTTFLKHFGEFKVAKLDTKEVSGAEYILDELKNLRMSINRLQRGRLPLRDHFDNFSSSSIRFEAEVPDDSDITLDELASKLSDIKGVEHIRVHEEDGNKRLTVDVEENANVKLVHEILSSISDGKSSKKDRPTSPFSRRAKGARG